jgi:hypothetical protein
LVLLLATGCGDDVTVPDISTPEGHVWFADAGRADFSFELWFWTLDGEFYDVTRVDLIFQRLDCGGWSPPDGQFVVRPPSPAAIGQWWTVVEAEQRFTIGVDFLGVLVRINGTFNPDLTEASGDWDLEDCSGTWTAQWPASP